MKINFFQILIFVIFLGSGSIYAQKSDSLFDSRDSKVYKTIKVGKQTWMAENLNFEIKNSWAYENLPENGIKYGRLYSWDAANQACPAGWHLPSDSEWKEVESFLGMSVIDLEKANDWRGTNQATMLISDSGLGFNILMGGYGNLPANFNLKDSQAFFWTSTLEFESAWFRQFYIQSPKILRKTRPKTWEFSVRCVKN